MGRYALIQSERDREGWLSHALSFGYDVKMIQGYHFIVVKRLHLLA